MQALNLEQNQTDKITKVKKKQFHHCFIQTVYDFASNTSLSGLKYMADGPSYMERLFWLTIFVLSAAWCFFNVYQTYMQWVNNAVIITLKEHLISVNEVPFPAVTICPQAIIKQDYYNFSREYRQYKKHNNDPEERYTNTRYYSTLVLCNKNDSANASIYRLPETDIRSIYTVVPKHEDVFQSCEWRGSNCTNSFREVLTADGVCFTFNTLTANDTYRIDTAQRRFSKYYLNTNYPQRNWTRERNTYYTNTYNHVYPRRGRPNGAKEDLFVVLKEIKDRDFRCEGHTRPGYKVYLHHPADVPQASLHYYTAHPERTTSLAIKLNILDTSNEVARYNPDVRQCFFPSERQLDFFQLYSVKNCQLECLAHYTFKHCNCVNLFMPRSPTTRLCTAHDLKCTRNAFLRYIFQESFNMSAVSKCRCLPLCHDIQYDADVVVTKFDQRESDRRLKHLDDDDEEDDDENVDDTDDDSDDDDDDDADDDDDDDDDLENDDDDDINKKSEIRIYFRHSQFVAMERSEMFGMCQFLADCGGTLGLFLGFSFLTLAEIFYFFTIKLCCIVRRNTPSESKESLNNQEQGSPNGRPRSASGPPTHFVRTATTQQLALQRT